MVPIAEGAQLAGQAFSIFQSIHSTIFSRNSWILREVIAMAATQNWLNEGPDRTIHHLMSSLTCSGKLPGLWR